MQRQLDRPRRQVISPKLWTKRIDTRRSNCVRKFSFFFVCALSYQLVRRNSRQNQNTPVNCSMFCHQTIIETTPLGQTLCIFRTWNQIFQKRKKKISARRSIHSFPASVENAFEQPSFLLLLHLLLFPPFPPYTTAHSAETREPLGSAPTLQPHTHTHAQREERERERDETKASDLLSESVDESRQTVLSPCSAHRSRTTSRLCTGHCSVAAFSPSFRLRSSARRCSLSLSDFISLNRRRDPHKNYELVRGPVVLVFRPDGRRRVSSAGPDRSVARRFDDDRRRSAPTPQRQPPRHRNVSPAALGRSPSFRQRRRRQCQSFPAGSRTPRSALIRLVRSESHPQQVNRLNI